MIQIIPPANTFVDSVCCFYSLDSRIHIWSTDQIVQDDSWNELILLNKDIKSTTPMRKLEPAEIRSTGLSRYKSTASALQFASIMIKKMTNSRNHPGNLGIFTISQTSTPGIAYQYESCGCKQNWGLVDPFWLPNSIPSALATSLAALIPNAKYACSFIGGVSEIFSAIEAAIYMLADNTIDVAVLLFAEQINDFQVQAFEIIGDKQIFFEGASALFLSKKKTPSSYWRLNSIGISKNSRPETTKVVAKPEPPIESLSFPLLLVEKFNCNQTFELAYKMPDNSNIYFDFVRNE